MGDFSILAVRIKELRSSLNMTQKEFSSFVGCTAATLSAYENGSKSPSLEIIKGIAEKCNVSIDWLCGLSNNKTYDDKILTYADMFRLIMKLVKTDSFFGKWDIIFEKNNKIDDLGRRRTNYAYLRNNDKTIVNFFKDWEQMHKLYKENTIDEHLYDLWLSDKLKLFENDQLCPTAN